MSVLKVASGFALEGVCSICKGNIWVTTAYIQDVSDHLEMFFLFVFVVLLWITWRKTHCHTGCVHFHVFQFYLVARQTNIPEKDFLCLATLMGWRHCELISTSLCGIWTSVLLKDMYVHKKSCHIFVCFTCCPCHFSCFGATCIIGRMSTSWSTAFRK